MKNKKILFIFFLAIILNVPIFVRAEVIFEDNFNSQSDWQPKPAGMADDSYPGGAATYDFSSVQDLYSTPSNWSFFRSTGIWWGPTYEETIRINNQIGHGIGSNDGAGKSFIVYNEANIGASGDGWGADGNLTKLFDQDYPELYARIWLKTQAGWKWAVNDDMMIKMFRIKHFDRTGSIFTGFPGGTLAPLVIWDFYHSNSWGTRWTNSLRCDPQETDYYCTTTVPGNNLFIPGDMATEPDASGMLADNAWHRLDFHLKMNTYNSALSTWNSDGIYKFSYDGVLRENYNDVNWKRAGSEELIGWNAFDLGGNAYNNYNDEWVDNHNYSEGDILIMNSYNWRALQTHLSSNSNRPNFVSNEYWENLGLISGQKEQWYAIDDVVVSTSAISEDYVIGGGDLVAPSSPSGLSIF